jgi:hypothetical protein
MNYSCKIGYNVLCKESRGIKIMDENNKVTVRKYVDSGITFGNALAIVISYTKWKSIGWAIFHGLLGWVYVIYYIIRY